MRRPDGKKTSHLAHRQQHTINLKAKLENQFLMPRFSKVVQDLHQTLGLNSAPVVSIARGIPEDICSSTMTALLFFARTLFNVIYTCPR